MKHVEALPIDSDMSDHALILFSLEVMRPHAVKKTIAPQLKLKLKLSGLSPPTSCFASRADVSWVTPTPHHGVTHGSNVLVDKSHSRTLTRI